MVEFALMLPLLMVLLLGIADFGRVFADGIALEAAVRNSSEAAAQEYLQFCSKYATSCAGLVQADYAGPDGLHALAQKVGCREAERLTNVVTVDDDGNPLTDEVCTNPVIAVCVHAVDGAALDLNCGAEGLASGVPAACSHMNDPAGWSPARAGPSNGRPYIEVRMCYQFNPLVTFPLGGWGTVWLQKTNNFPVTNY